MSLMQFIGSLIAVTIVAWIASRLFHSPNKLTVERVIRNTARYCPHIDLTAETPTVFISKDGGTAVLVFPKRSDGIALLTALGDRVVVREISDLQTIEILKTGTELRLDINDFTQPTLKINLSETDQGALLAAIEQQPAKHTEAAHA